MTTSAPPSAGRGWKLLALAVLALALPALGVAGAYEPLQQAAAWLREQGLWTAPLFMVLAGLCTGLALLPTHATSLMAGYVYGLGGGLPTAIVAVLLGAWLGLLAARRLSGDTLRLLLAVKPWARALAAGMIDTTLPRATLAVGLARLPPQVPFALANVLAASASVRPLAFLAGTAVGMLPRVAAVVWLGAQLQAWSAEERSPLSLALAVGGVALGMGGLGWWSWRIIRRARPADVATSAGNGA